MVALSYKGRSSLTQPRCNGDDCGDGGDLASSELSAVC